MFKTIDRESAHQLFKEIPESNFSQEVHLLSELERRVDEANNIGDIGLKSNLLRIACQELLDNGISDRAVEVAMSIPINEKKDVSLKVCAGHFAGKGNIQAATNILSLIYSFSERRKAVIFCANALIKSGEIDSAQNLAYVFLNPIDQVRIFKSCCDAHISSGRIDRAFAIAEDNSFEDIKNICQRSCIKKALVLSGDVRSCVDDIQNKISLEDQRNECRRECVSILVNLGDIESALSFIEQISDEQGLSESKKECVFALIKLGDILNAIELAKSIPFESLQGESLFGCIKALIDIDQLDNGLELVGFMTDNFKYKARALGLCGANYAMRGDISKTIETISGHGSVAFTECIFNLLKSGKTKEGLHFLELIKNRLSTHYSVDCVRYLVRDPDTINIAWDIAQSIPQQGVERNIMFRLCANNFARFAQLEKFSEVLDSSNNIRTRNLLLFDYSELLASKGNLDHAIEVAQSIADDEMRDKSLHFIVVKLARLGHIRRAFDVFQMINNPILLPVWDLAEFSD